MYDVSTTAADEQVLQLAKTQHYSRACFGSILAKDTIWALESCKQVGEGHLLGIFCVNLDCVNACSQNMVNITLVNLPSASKRAIISGLFVQYSANRLSKISSFSVRVVSLRLNTRSLAMSLAQSRRTT